MIARNARSLLLAPLLLLPTLASAQQTSNSGWTIEEPPPDDILFDTAGSAAISAPFRDLYIARLTDVGDLDALVLGAQHLHVVSSLARFGVPVRVVDNATCATTLSTAGFMTYGLPDMIVAATGISFERRIYHPGSGLIGAFPALYLVPGLSDAIAMAPANLDGMDVEDLLTLGADGRTVQGWTFDKYGDPSLAFTFSATADVLGLAAVRAGAPGTGDDIALATTAGLQVHDHTGTVLASIDEANVSGAELAVLRSETAAPDSVVYARQFNGTGDWSLALLTGTQATQLGALRVQLDSSMPLTSVEVTGLDVGDADSDGDLDLLVAQSTYQSALVFDNGQTTGAPVFDLTTGAQRVFNLSETPAVPVAGTWPMAFADVDSDGRADAVAAHLGIHGLKVSEAYEANPTPGNIGFSVPAPIFEAIAREEFAVSSGEVDDPLRLFFEIPTSVDASTYGYLQIQAWDRPAGAPIDPGAIVNELHPIPTAPSSPSGLSAQNIGVDLDLGLDPMAGWTEGRAIYLTYRLVNATVSGTTVDAITDSTDWLLSGLTLKPDINDGLNTAYRGVIENDTYAGTLRDLYELDSDGGPGAQGITLGVGASMGSLTHLIELPRPGPLVLSSDVWFHDPSTGYEPVTTP